MKDMTAIAIEGALRRDIHDLAVRLFFEPVPTQACDRRSAEQSWKIAREFYAHDPRAKSSVLFGIDKGTDAGDSTALQVVDMGQGVLLRIFRKFFPEDTSVSPPTNLAEWVVGQLDRLVAQRDELAQSRITRTMAERACVLIHNPTTELHNILVDSGIDAMVEVAIAKALEEAHRV